MAGKGSGRRPQQVPDSHVQSEWDRIFGRKEEDCNHDAPKDEREEEPGSSESVQR